MSDEQHETAPEVSFAEVADESAAESVAHEEEALAAIEEDGQDQDAQDGPLIDAGALEDNTAPEQPTISSMLGVGRVSEGDDTVL